VHRHAPLVVMVGAVVVGGVGPGAAHEQDGSSVTDQMSDYPRERPGPCRVAKSLT
jgi:hypothetical protein